MKKIARLWDKTVDTCSSVKCVASPRSVRSKFFSTRPARQRPRGVDIKKHRNDGILNPCIPGAKIISYSIILSSVIQIHIWNMVSHIFICRSNDFTSVDKFLKSVGTPSCYSGDCENRCKQLVRNS